MDIILLSKLYLYLLSPFTWVFLILGLVLGSFYNVCIVRIPNGTFWKEKRSVCQHCNAKVPIFLNIPLFSWVFLRGKTACCKKKLSIQYPVVEGLTAIGFAVIYWNFPFLLRIDSSIMFDSGDLIRFLHAAIFFSILVICSFIDLEHLIIPDVFSLGLVVSTPLWILIHPELTWSSALFGILAGGGILYGVAWLYWLLRKQAGMGMGDVKLLAGMGGWLGFESVFPIVFYSSVSGSIIGIILMLVKRRATMKFEIPFGPFLALGAMLFLFYGSSLIAFILGRA